MDIMDTTVLLHPSMNRDVLTSRAGAVSVKLQRESYPIPCI